MIIGRRTFPERGRRQGPSEDEAEVLHGTDLDTIEEWLCVVMDARDEMKENGHHLFSPWEREYVVSLNDQYDAKHLAGYHHSPLTVRQLYYLRRMYDHLVADTQERLAKAAERDFQ